MKEIEGNIWDFHPANYITIPTNGTIRKDGACVMGRGLALEASRKFKILPYLLGEDIRRIGNVPFDYYNLRLLTFPVKYNWWEKADLELIKQSAELFKHFFKKIETIYLPEVGCGNGKLEWAEVKPIIEPIFNSDKFIIVHFKP